MKSLALGLLSLVALASAAGAQVCPTVPIDLTSATRVMDGTSLFAMNWRTRLGPAATMTNATRWSPGLNNGWSTNQDGTGPVYLSAINIGSEDQYYVTYEGLQGLGATFFPVKSDGPAGPLRIHPRLATAAEKAKLDTRADLGTHNWLSAAMTTMPEGLFPPWYMEVEYTLPAGVNGNQSGLWPAFWGLDTNGNWPPEIDSMEQFGGPISASLHTTDGSWLAKVRASFKAQGIALSYSDGDANSAVASQWITTGAQMQGKHRYGSLLNSTGLYHYYDRKCVVAYPLPADMGANSRTFPLINLAIGKPGSGPGAPPAGATDLGELVVNDFGAWSYGAVTPPPPPPPPPPPVLTTGLTVTAPPATVAGPITLSGTAGTAWLNVGLFAPGWVNVGTDVKPVGGKWTMAVDTSKLKLGPNTLTIVGFSVAAGQPDGTSKSVPLTLKVVAPLTPIAAALAVLTADLANATAKTKGDLAALARLLVGK